MPTVLVDDLSIIDSPRLTGVNADHVRTLSESAERWPPITVHRTTMRVLDGVHRVQSARLLGQRHIEADFYEGTDHDAFVVAVQANTRHGLPLSLADRTRAAERIIGSHPQWSNGKIAAVTGLSAKTVAAVRRCSTPEIPESNTRLGLDGRVRPLDTAAARLLAGELLRDHHGAPIREIAKAAKLSVSTAWDVRKRLERGEHPVPQRRRAQGGPRRTAGRRPVDPANLLRTLSRDPSLRSTESGRALLRRLHATSTDPGEWDRLLETGNIPPHCIALVAELALVNAQSWTDLARRLRAQPARAS